jgi:lipoyl(octanoyl) transferase
MFDPVVWEWWGSDLCYSVALERQFARRDAVIAGRGGECLALLEHRSVITVGRRPAPGTPSPQALAAQGIDFCRTNRGGLATWHGPGQLIGYLVVDVWARKLGIKALVHGVETGVINWLGDIGIAADQRCGFPGVWVGQKKIAAIGFHFSRGVSMHGFALNLGPDLSGFGRIVPCGIADGGVATVANLMGSAPDPVAAAPSVARSILGSLSLLDGAGSDVRFGPRFTTSAGA